MTDSLMQYEAVKHFNLGNITSCTTCNTGHINYTYVITNDRNEKYILQAINKTVFRNPDMLMENIVNVCEHIKNKAADKKRNVLNVIPSDSGSPIWYDKNGIPWRVYRYVPNAVCLKSCPSAEQFYKVGKAFGLFQKKLDDFDVSKLRETIPHFHDTAKRYDDFFSAVQKNSACRAIEVRNEIHFLTERKAKATVISKMLADGLLPIRVTHNDTKLSNIMIDPETGEGVCIIDLDTVMPGSVLYDFGDAIRYGASKCVEDETNSCKVTFDVEMYKAYKKGFLESLAGVLKKDELRLLPLGVYTMTLETGMRFLTDYLNGDVYFRIDHPSQNLDRARNQFMLVKDLENRADEFNLIFE